eukprot:CAMPEP_0172490546 /NCGR_PEP_ID=MMETSP1066-20121228/21015_1 /TAXON_ID=671091 /ORGANISM="Coscinodiscus wailesii, Strain CCMP2513" /LENGTH=232 /DNA_ID=CAMNT_0013259067 /DNA_START=64 /DNA_END=762 /DNA_ORIENTATION=+
MTRLSSALLITLSTISSTSAYVPASTFVGSSVGRRAPSTSRPETRVNENFGFDFAEDQKEIAPQVLLGEANYKQWVGTVNENSFLNRQYNVIKRVRELDLIKLTAENGILSKLEKNGVDLKTLESLLPVAEQFGALSLVANNQQLLVNLVAPLLVEPAPLLLPVIAGALEAGPSAFYLASAVCLGLDALLVVNNVEIPFIGLSAGVVLGLLLVPLAVVSGGAGVALASASKN